MSTVLVNIPATFQALENFKLNLNAGWLYNRPNDLHWATWGASFDWSVNDRISLIGEVFGQVGHEIEDPPHLNDPRAQFAFRFKPNENVDFDVIYGRNIIGENAHWITVGLNVRFNAFGERVGGIAADPAAADPQIVSLRAALRRLDAHRQHARDMQRLAVGAVADLVAAGGAVGDDDRILRRLAHRRQQRQLAHLERHVDGVGAVAEGAGHAAAARLDRLDRKPRHELQRASRPRPSRRRISGGNGRAAARACRSARAAASRLELARHELLEQHGARRHPARFVGLQQGRDLVAEAEDAARLEPDDRNAAVT